MLRFQATAGGQEPPALPATRDGLTAGRSRLYYERMQLGFPEMIFIFVLALIIFGPKKLPEIGRQIGKALAEFKRASNEFKYQLETEMRQLETENKPAGEGAAATPENSIAGGIGRAVAEFQRFTGEAKSRLENGLRNLEAETNASTTAPAKVESGPVAGTVPTAAVESGSIAAPTASPAEPTPPEAKGADA